jgi:hypothetical protein
MASAYERVKAWRAANPDKWAEQKRRYAKRHPEQLVAKTLRWKANNPERAAEVSRNTRLKNAGRVQANKSKYRASKKNRTPNWITTVSLFEMQCIYAYRAALQSVGLNYEVDHIIPLQGKIVSGLHTPENLQVIPTIQNRIKNNRYAE